MATTVFSGKTTTLAASEQNLILTEETDTENFESFTNGPIVDGTNGWKNVGTHDDEIVDLSGNHKLRMSSDPSDGAFGGPYSRALSGTAGEPSTTADFSNHVISFTFQAVNPVADNSRLEVDFGLADGTDRNNFMVIESINGQGIRIAVNEPQSDGINWANNDFSAFTGNRELISGVDSSVEHTISLELEYVDGPNNDILKIFLDGVLIGTTTTFENYRDFHDPSTSGNTHDVNAEMFQTGRLFFRGSASGAPNDGNGGENQGFYFDDITNVGFNNADGTGNSLDNVMIGNRGTNTLSGLGGDDVLSGGDGNDTLLGGSGNDVLKGDLGADLMQGGSGNDTYYVDQKGDVVDESVSGSSGVDTVISSISFSLNTSSRVKGTIENLTLVGSDDTNGIGNAKANIIYGNRGENIIDGKGGSDHIYGLGGKDTLRGGDGADTIYGNSGDDIITGGNGRDWMVGGSGSDTFDFNAVSECHTTSRAYRDVIVDFTRGEDNINLRSIDAKTGTNGNQVFTWIGTDDFSKTQGELHYIDNGSNVLVEGDVDGDGKADLQIIVKVGALDADDFAL